jgi:hypothetical protein
MSPKSKSITASRRVSELPSKLSTSKDAEKAKKKIVSKPSRGRQPSRRQAAPRGQTRKKVGKGLQFEDDLSPAQEIVSLKKDMSSSSDEDVGELFRTKRASAKKLKQRETVSADNRYCSTPQLDSHDQLHQEVLTQSESTSFDTPINSNLTVMTSRATTSSATAPTATTSAALILAGTTSAATGQTVATSADTAPTASTSADTHQLIDELFGGTEPDDLEASTSMAVTTPAKHSAPDKPITSASLTGCDETFAQEAAPSANAQLTARKKKQVASSSGGEECSENLLQCQTDIKSSMGTASVNIDELFGF